MNIIFTVTVWPSLRFVSSYVYSFILTVHGKW